MFILLTHSVYYSGNKMSVKHQGDTMNLVQKMEGSYG